MQQQNEQNHKNDETIRKKRIRKTTRTRTFQPPPPSVELACLTRLDLLQTQHAQAVFPLTGISAERCIDGMFNDTCGFDMIACGQMNPSTSNSSSTAISLSASCADLRLQLATMCSADMPAVQPKTCEQPRADSPFLDINLGSQRELRVISLSAPVPSFDLGYFELSSGPDTDHLSPCTWPSGVADGQGGPFLFECNDEAAQWVRVLLPGKSRTLQLS